MITIQSEERETNTMKAALTTWKFLPLELKGACGFDTSNGQTCRETAIVLGSAFFTDAGLFSVDLPLNLESIQFKAALQRDYYM